MPICHGEIIKSKKISSVPPKFVAEYLRCGICKNTNNKEDFVQCWNILCKEPFHVLCLARYSEDDIIPVEKECPKCKETFIWQQWISSLQKK